jgi:hypothetical protein
MDGRSDELPENGTYSFLPSRSSCHHRHYAPNRRNPHRIERHRHLVAARAGVVVSRDDGTAHLCPVHHLISLANRNKLHIDDVLMAVVHALITRIRLDLILELESFALHWFQHQIGTLK